MKDLLVAVPSRGRPGNIRRLADAMRATCTGDTSLVVGLDLDDPAVDEYPADVDSIVQGDLHRVTAWVNALTIPAADKYRYLGHVGDDNVPHTSGWDTQVMAALEKTPFAFGNDQYPLRPPGILCCHVFMRSEVVRKLGYFGPPSLVHMYVDVAWMAWGTACGITYLHNVNLEHLHFTIGKSAPDDTYTASQNLAGSDLQNWHAYSRGGGLNEDIGKLGGTPFTPQALTEFNQRLAIPE